MPRKPTGRPSQRPCAEIDWKKVETMVMAGCSGTEIAGAFGIHPDTFYVRFEKEYGLCFTAYRSRKKEGGDGNIRLRQYISAMNGNTQMLKLLGEERLGQGKRDESEGSEARTLIYFAEKIEKLEAALHARGISFSEFSDEQPVSHQGCPGEK